MIDVKELRVGAHINVNGKRVTVDEITNTSLVAYITNDNDWAACSPDEDWINPIPLTAALLDEIGFEPVRKVLGKADEEWRTELDGSPITITKGYSADPEREWGVHIDSWDYDTIGAAEVAYLHQLENIIYLCTGKELIKEDFNDAPDCRYFSEGNCAKGLPGTPCKRKGCEAYYQKKRVNMKIESINDYLQGIRDFESYRHTHNLFEELKREFPIGTELKPVDGMVTSSMDEGMEVIGGYDTSDPYLLTFKVKSKIVERGEVIAHRVQVKETSKNE